MAPCDKRQFFTYTLSNSARHSVPSSLFEGVVVDEALRGMTAQPTFTGLNQPCSRHFYHESCWNQISSIQNPRIHTAVYEPQAIEVSPLKATPGIPSDKWQPGPRQTFDNEAEFSSYPPHLQVWGRSSDKHCDMSIQGTMPEEWTRGSLLITRGQQHFARGSWIMKHCVLKEHSSLQ